MYWFSWVKSSFHLRGAPDRPLRATWAKTEAPTLLAASLPYGHWPLLLFKWSQLKIAARNRPFFGSWDFKIEIYTLTRICSSEVEVMLCIIISQIIDTRSNRLEVVVVFSLSTPESFEFFDCWKVVFLSSTNFMRSICFHIFCKFVTLFWCE